MKNATSQFKNIKKIACALRNCRTLAGRQAEYASNARSVQASMEANAIVSRRATRDQLPSRGLLIMVASSLSKLSVSPGVNSLALTPCERYKAKPWALAASIGVPQLM